MEVLGGMEYDVLLEQLENDSVKVGEGEGEKEYL